VYQEDSIVFFWVEELKKFSVLYDFGAIKDSSWEINFYDIGLQKAAKFFVRVDSIGKRIINQNGLNSQFVTYSRDSLFHENNINSEIIEVIGDFNFIFTWYHTIFDANYVSGLRCFKDSKLGLYSTGIVPFCTYTQVSAEEIIRSEKIRIYPNPTSTILNLELLHNSNYQIIEISGRVIQENSLNQGKNSIDVQHLKAGIYFLKVEHKGEIKSFKFLKE